MLKLPSSVATGSFDMDVKILHYESWSISELLIYDMSGKQRNVQVATWSR